MAVLLVVLIGCESRHSAETQPPGVGHTAEAGPEVLNNNEGSEWRTTTSNLRSRINPGVARLGGEFIIVVGGNRDDAEALRSTEILNLQTHEWSTGPQLLRGRDAMTVLSTPAGGVAVAGGAGRNVVQPSPPEVLASVEILDDAENGWRPAASMIEARAYFTWTDLGDGRALAAGGRSVVRDFNHQGDRFALSSAELYDYATDQWANVRPMLYPRQDHSALRLEDGRLLVVGGWTPGGYVSRAEAFDVSSGTWNELGETSGRVQALTALADGRVVAIGHQDNSSTIVLECLQDDGTGWETIGVLNAPQASRYTTARFGAGILIIGGRPRLAPSAATSQVHHFDFDDLSWHEFPSLQNARQNHVAIELHNGVILVIGGYTLEEDRLIHTSELFDPY